MTEGPRATNQGGLLYGTVMRETEVGPIRITQLYTLVFESQMRCKRFHTMILRRKGTQNSIRVHLSGHAARLQRAEVVLC